MMRRRARHCLAILAALALSAPALAETDQEVAARAVAWSWLGPFANDGFKLRDGHWGRHPRVGRKQDIAVNLYAGNEYWLSAGATEKQRSSRWICSTKPGAPVAAETFNSGTKAAAGFSVTNSGQYFVRVRLEEGEAAGVCFLYSYK
jgi:hypothetical protein